MWKISWLITIASLPSFFMLPVAEINASTNTNLDIEKAAADLRSWQAAIYSCATDYNQYPQQQSIDDLAVLLDSHRYWDQPIRIDPWGNPYVYQSDQRTFKIWSAGPDRRPDRSVGR